MKNKLVNSLFALSFLILLVVLYFTLTQNRKVVSYNNWVDHTYQVKNNLLDIESKFRAMVVNQRTYLLTNDSSYYHRYYDRMNEVKLSVDRLKSNVLDNERQTENWAILNKSLNDRTKSIDEELIFFRSANGKTSLDKKIIENQAHSLEFIKEVNQMLEVENQLLKKRIEMQRKSEEIATIFYISMWILAMSALIFAFLKHRKDLSQMVELLSTKRALLNRIVKINKDLEEYNYLATHDLQEPLRKIQMFVSTINKNFKDGNKSQIQYFLDKLEKSAEEANDMVKGLQEHSMLNSEEILHSPVDLKQIFEDTISFYKIKNEPELKINMRSAGKTPLVPGSHAQMNELFENIIANAIKFRKPDKNEVNIEFSHRIIHESDHKYLRVTIKDDGVGFDQIYENQLFDIFNKLRLDNRSNPNNLGLSKCKKIMENHKGSITARSAKNNGAEFICTFPVDI